MPNETNYVLPDNRHRRLECPESSLDAGCYRQHDLMWVQDTALLQSVTSLRALTDQVLS